MIAFCEICQLDHQLNGIDINELRKIEESQKFSEN
jgi:hypothetical protein